MSVRAPATFTRHPHMTSTTRANICQVLTYFRPSTIVMAGYGTKRLNRVANGVIFGTMAKDSKNGGPREHKG